MLLYLAGTNRVAICTWILTYNWTAICSAYILGTTSKTPNSKFGLVSSDLKINKNVIQIELFNLPNINEQTTKVNGREFSTCTGQVASNGAVAQLTALETTCK